MNGPILTISPPGNLSGEDLKAFSDYVAAAGEVNPDTFPRLLARARSLALVHIGEAVVAVGALKRPNAGYRDQVFTKARATERVSQFEFELGWVYVVPAARGRGLSTEVVKGLISDLGAASAYATSRTDNRAMHAALDHGGFKATGSTYPSQFNEPELQLFVRQ